MSPDFEHGFTELKGRASFRPQVRIYLFTEGRPPITALFPALPDYEMVLARSRDELVFLRKMSMESEAQFRRECRRVAEIVAPLVVPDCHLHCAYDNAAGRTGFAVELQKTGASAAFVETDAAAGRKE